MPSAWARDNLVLESLQEVQRALGEIAARTGQPCVVEEPAAAGCDLFALGLVPNSPSETKNFGKVTRFWAQTNAGADLAWERMEQLRAGGESLGPVPVGVCDSGFTLSTLPRDRLSRAMRDCTRESCPRMGSAFAFVLHGEAVSNLVAGAFPLSASPVTVLNSVVPGTQASFSCEQALDVAEPPRFVNISLGLPKQSGSFDEFARKSFVTIASGNAYPYEWVEPNAKHAYSIGSVTPNGLVSSFSQLDPALLVGAPSDNFGVSIDQHGKFIPFGGTSGAAPLASGALANLAALLPGVSNEEIALIAGKTAYRSVGFRVSPFAEGAGSLNAYRALRVAERLRSGWPGNRARLREADLFDFTAEAEAAWQKYRRLEAGEPACAQRKTAFAELRKAFFLNPEASSVAGAVAAEYENAGYLAEARFFRNGSAAETLSSIPHAGERVAVAVRNGLPYAAHLEALAGLTPEERTFFIFQLAGTREAAFPALARLLELEPSATKEVLSFFTTHEAAKKIDSDEGQRRLLRAKFNEYLLERRLPPLE